MNTALLLPTTAKAGMCVSWAICRYFPIANGMLLENHLGAFKAIKAINSNFGQV